MNINSRLYIAKFPGADNIAEVVTMYELNDCPPIKSLFTWGDPFNYGSDFNEEPPSACKLSLEAGKTILDKDQHGGPLYRLSVDEIIRCITSLSSEEKENWLLLPLLAMLRGFERAGIEWNEDFIIVHYGH